MIEFFFGVFVGILAAVLPLFAGWLTKQEHAMVKELESNDFDYTKAEKTLEDKLDSPFDPENYFKNFKREGTR